MDAESSNPTNGQFVIAITLPGDINTLATIQVINTLGQVMYNESASLVNGVMQRQIMLKDTPDGIYLVKVTVNGDTFTSQMMISKK